MLYLRVTTVQNKVVRINRAIPAITVAMIYSVTFIVSVAVPENFEIKILLIRLAIIESIPAVPATDGDRLPEAARFARSATVAPLDTRSAMAEVTIF
ncbi:MAG TPA: hypothetical protein ENH28_00760 [Euryarchaeota archaeon]|nr:hypothetical protein BMS3Bbin15_01011 [archaeon BMS3Bbin15]HDL14683.1 hypothetical protein [Euryarchaeota archaeon]